MKEGFSACVSSSFLRKWTENFLCPAQDKDAENQHAVAKAETLGNKLQKPHGLHSPPSE